MEEICDLLLSRGLPATRYHAGLDPEERRENQDDFLYDRKTIMVATNAFGMGIDKPDVRFIIHVDMPKSIENFFQETGRAGRDGKPAESVLYYGLEDLVQQRFFIDKSEADPMYKQVSLHKLDSMLGLAESAGCRRIQLTGLLWGRSLTSRAAIATTARIPFDP